MRSHFYFSKVCPVQSPQPVGLRIIDNLHKSEVALKSFFPNCKQPRRRCVRRRSAAASRRKAEETFPAQRSGSCCAAAQLRHPDPPGTFTSCRALRDPRRESGRAREPSTSLLTHWEEESAARRPRTPRVPPSGRPSALALPRTHAGGDGQDATAISARGEGRSSSAVPAESCGLPRNSSSGRPPPLSSPFSSRADG